MSEDTNPTADLDSAQAQAAWEAAQARGDWLALSQLQEFDEAKPGVPEGVPVRTTLDARDVR